MISLSSPSNILNRRYELPTCRLEIWTERSPLSEWQSQIVAQNLKFKLRLGDSLGNRGKLIKGNQQQISCLIEAVTTYCDRWLAQDKFDSLTHKISIPKSSKLNLSTLQLSTVQLFDLYEGLELCASEFVILPTIVLEVRRISPSWLKIAASMLAIIGVSFGAIRLISRDQASYQIAQPTSVLSPEITALSPSPQKTESIPSTSSQPVAPASPKTTSPSNDRNVREIPSQDSEAIAPESKPRVRDQDQNDITAIAPQISQPASEPNIVRQRTSDNSNFAKPPAAATLEAPSPETGSPSIGRSESVPTEQSTASKLAIEAPAMRSSAPVNRANNGANTDTDKLASIKILNVKSTLPTQVYTDLARYVQYQKITSSAKGTISFEIDLSGQEVVKIELKSESSTLADASAVQTLQKLITQWRSPIAATGKIYITLQIN